MGDVIYLDRYRKAKARAEKEQKADWNRVRHGRTKAEKQASRREQQRQADDLAGKVLDAKDVGPDVP